MLLDRHPESTAQDVDGSITSPDVQRYSDVLRRMPDAMSLAMRNLGEAAGLPLVDADTAMLISSLVRGRHDLRVVELGTGIGYLTLHLARALDHSSTLVSIDANPHRQGQAHEFLGRVEYDCAVELRLGDPTRMLRSVIQHGPIDVLVLSDPTLNRMFLLDEASTYLSRDGLVLLPFALRGGRVAQALRGWENDEIHEQRKLNRALTTDPRFSDVALLPVGDGLLMARRA